MVLPLGVNPRRIGDETSAYRRIWATREASYRRECEEILGEARRSLEQRTVAERSRIEAALESFKKDFHRWIETEKLGGSGPKPTLRTLLDIWFEKGAKPHAFESVSSGGAKERFTAAEPFETELSQLNERMQRVYEQTINIEQQLQ